MRKILSVLLVVMLVFVVTAPVFADAGEKFKGGIEQFVKSPLQIKDAVTEEYEASTFKPFGVVGGLLKGLFYTVKEAGLGLVNVLTFAIDNE